MTTTVHEQIHIHFYPDAPERLLRGNPLANEMVRRVSQAAVEYAKQICPVTDGDHRAAIIDGGVEHDAAGFPFSSFGSTSSTWHLIEYGSLNNPAYRVLTRAAEHVFHRYIPLPKP